MHHCDHCKQEIPPSLVIEVRDHPESIEPDGIEVRFCCWECAAMWFNKKAGEILMPDLDADFFGPESDHMRKWG